MKIVPAKTPWLLKKIFSKYVWNIPVTDHKVVYLTFDDGPIPKVTDWVLDILHEYNAKATFFCIGDNVQKYPEIYQRILREGHKTGNHTYNHLNGWSISNKMYLKNIEHATKYIHSNLFRPPYGKIKLSQSKKLRALGYKIIMWDVIAVDWDPNTSMEKSAKNVLKNSKNGSIIVFHDSIKAEKNMQYALSKTLAYFKKEGYSFKSLEHLLVR